MLSGKKGVGKRGGRMGEKGGGGEEIAHTFQWLDALRGRECNLLDRTPLPNKVCNENKGKNQNKLCCCCSL